MIISDEMRNLIVDAATAALNGGALVFREGSTTRMTFAIKSPAFGSADEGSAALDTTSPTMSATAASNAVEALDNYQFLTSGGAVRISGDIGDIDSGAEIEMNHRDVLVGDVATMDDYTLTMPSGA